MNKNSGFKKKGKSGGSSQSTRKAKSDVEIGDDPVLQMFNEISIYLDSRHDKKERIVKLRKDEKLEFPDLVCNTQSPLTLSAFVFIVDSEYIICKVNFL